MTTGRPRGVRDWDREPYFPAPANAAAGKVKISTSVKRETHQLFHQAARAAGVSLAYLLEELADRLLIDKEAGAVMLDETPITSPRKGQEALVTPP